MCSVDIIRLSLLFEPKISKRYVGKISVISMFKLFLRFFTIIERARDVLFVTSTAWMEELFWKMKSVRGSLNTEYTYATSSSG